MDAEWVPCSERLPERYCACYITILYRDGRRKVKEVMYTPTLGMEVWATGSGGVIINNVDRLVIAWMAKQSIPEPYEGE